LGLAVSLALAAGCDRRPTTPPSPKTDSTSALPSAAAGSSTTPANAGTPTTSEKREGSNPTQGQVDPKHADQHRDFQQKGDGAGPTSSDTKPTMKN
jgi:hypothetical protein